MQNRSVNFYRGTRDSVTRVPNIFPVNRLRNVEWFKRWGKSGKRTKK